MQCTVQMLIKCILHECLHPFTYPVIPYASSMSCNPKEISKTLMEVIICTIHTHARICVHACMHSFPLPSQVKVAAEFRDFQMKYMYLSVNVALCLCSIFTFLRLQCVQKGQSFTKKSFSSPLYTIKIIDTACML